MKRTALFALATSAAFTTCVVACSLGLDASKIPSDVVDTGLTETGSGDVAQAPDASGTYTPCSTANDCKAPNACATPRCDDVRKVCVYDQCPSGAACSAIACNQPALTCAATPTSYGFHAGAIHLPSGAIGCNGVAERCFAAAYPFVFAGTATGGIVAYSVANPSDAKPPQVTVDGVGFAPAFIVSSGERVWFLGNRVLAGAGYQLPVAYLDVPTDPTLKQVTAVSTLVQTPNTNIAAVLPADKGGVLVLLDDQGLPSTRLDPPIAQGAQLSFAPLGGFPAGASLVASSGSRLLTFRQSGSGPAIKTFLSLESAAGTVSSQNAGEQEVTTQVGAIYPNGAYATAPSGAVAAAYPTAEIIDGGVTGVGSVTLHVLVGDGNATMLDGGAKGVDVETYSPATGAGVVGPIAWLDDSKLLALAAVKGDGGNDSAVHVVTRTPGALGKEKFVLPGDPSRYVAAGSHGFGYVLGTDTGATDFVIHVFAPGCP